MLGQPSNKIGATLRLRTVKSVVELVIYSQ